MKTERITPDAAAGLPQTQAQESPVHLAGYELTTLLGTGGYGEVWKAIGPGGFPKAVKVLHGRRNGEQAGAELKALNRMRDLRHPFLLSIERVEVCENRLFVVTELADGNLTQRFEACVQKGFPGIPRDELLNYLREAADALDFMSEEHGLQHLDIKPDNLLLQGKHVKLGDFGLAKDISVTNVSLINGFTPLYASPELFEGRPGRFSDQYSLAIVFQSMLTGIAPFNGRNAAQLTSQHLRSQPDLSALASPDRPVIARALAKTPSLRFPSCREFIQELIDRTGRGRSGSTSLPPGRVELTPSGHASGAPSSTTASRPANAEASKPLRPTVSESISNTLRPTLFIGVGGLAGEILRQIKGEWKRRTSVNVPAWQVLAIDTDPQSLRNIPGLDSAEQLNDVETLPIALRPSQAYRKARNIDLSWLSRRWLFNIPRSGRVEGMRPLARLAVQDHLEALKVRIRDRISAAIEADAVLQSAAAVELPIVDNELDVYVVAATSGGTGSGAVNDLGLLVKQLATEFPGAKINVNSVLLHSTSRQQRVDGIEVANTMACLKELRLLSVDGMGIPKGFSRDASEFCPFDRTWLFYGGDQLEDADFNQLKVDVAGLLVNTTTTAAAATWRAENAALESSPDEPSIRLIGTATVDGDVYSMAEAEAASLASAILDRWIDPAHTVGEAVPPTTECVHELLKSLHLTSATLPTRILQELRGNSGKRIEELVTQVLQRLTPDAGPVTCGELLAREFESGDPTGGASLLRQLEDQLRRRLNRECESGQSKIRSMMLDLMEVAGPNEMRAAVETVRAELLAAHDCCRELTREIDLAFQALRSGADASALASSETTFVQEFCRQYSVLSGSSSIYHVFEQSLHQLLGSLDEVASETKTVVQTLLDTRELLGELHSVHNGIPEPVISAFRSYVSDDEQMRLRNILTRGFERQAFATRLLDSATGFLLAAGGTDSAHSDTFPASAWPGIRGVGGSHRVLAWVNESPGQQRWKSRFSDEFGDCVNVFPSSLPHVTAICETQNVESARVLKYFQSQNPSAWDMAGRIHTRSDIQW